MDIQSEKERAEDFQLSSHLLIIQSRDVSQLHSGEEINMADSQIKRTNDINEAKNNTIKFGLGC